MLRTVICHLLVLFIVTRAFPQAIQLPHQYRTEETIHFLLLRALQERHSSCASIPCALYNVYGDTIRYNLRAVYMLVNSLGSL